MIEKEERNQEKKSKKEEKKEGRLQSIRSHEKNRTQSSSKMREARRFDEHALGEKNEALDCGTSFQIVSLIVSHLLLKCFVTELLTQRRQLY